MTIELPPDRVSDGQAVLSPGADPRANRGTEPSSTIARRRSALSPEGRRLRKLTDGERADEVGTLEARIDALKAEAIRRLVERALVAEPPAPSARSKGAPKAAEMASREINKLGDETATDEERATRKRRLISGPKEFRDMRRK